MGLWGGRFSEPTDKDLQALNDSIGFDIRFYREDIEGSIAYAKAIAAANVITDDEAQTIIDALRQILREFEQNEFEIQAGDEDIHTAVERRLIEIVGAVGGKLHTGRSRNDQVATDFRLWTIRESDKLDKTLLVLQETLIEVAEQHIEVLMPGYTHMQPAQPITVAHWLMSFFWMIDRDRDRIKSAQGRTSVMPLGSGALAGNPFPIDRELITNELSFSSYSHNSLDAVSDRDFVCDLLYTIALCATHLSRLAEDIIIYSNPLFGYITLDDRYSTGSSLMPQKRNADPMELMRGKTGRLIGNLTGFLTTLKGLPSGYNKDLQEDKEALFDSFDSISKLLPVIIAIIKTLNINPDKMEEALTEELLATDVADYLVRKGMPFREAHHIVGEIVRIATNSQRNMSSLQLSELQTISNIIDKDIYQVFDFKRSVSQRSVAGGTSPDAIKQQIRIAKSKIE